MVRRPTESTSCATSIAGEFMMSLLAPATAKTAHSTTQARTGISPQLPTTAVPAVVGMGQMLLQTY